jgi:hypothetical protein
MLFNSKSSDSFGLCGALAFKGDRDKLQLLSCYELTLERSLLRALHELQRLQAERRDLPVVLPATVDMMVDVTTDVGSEEEACNGFVRQECQFSGASSARSPRKPKSV